MSSSAIYLVLVTEVIGGAEKRFTQLWLYCKRQGREDCRLVLSRKLWEHLLAIDEFQDLKNFERSVTFLPGVSFRELRAGIRQIQQQDASSVFHFVALSPALIWRRRPPPILLSITDASLSLYGPRGLGIILWGAFLSKCIDAVDPDVCRHMRRLFYFKRKHVYNTPNTAVDLDVFKPVDFSERRNRLVYVGLFYTEKQAPRLLSMLPKIDAELKSSGFSDLEYYFLGREGDDPEFLPRCRELSKSMDIQAYFEPNPQLILREAKIAFSVQRLTNYPSRSLLEFLASGCQVVVTDVGDTRRIVQEQFGHFVPRDFDERQIIRHCKDILSMQREEYEQRVSKAREFLRQNFSIESMAQYYFQLYDVLKAKAV